MKRRSDNEVSWDFWIWDDIRRKSQSGIALVADEWTDLPQTKNSMDGERFARGKSSEIERRPVGLTEPLILDLQAGRQAAQSNAAGFALLLRIGGHF
jgi:hypothetical protein